MQPWKNPLLQVAKRTTRLAVDKRRQQLVQCRYLRHKNHAGVGEYMRCLERSDAFFGDHGSVLLGCLSSGHSFIGIRARLASLLLTLSRGMRMSRIGMIMIAWTV